MNKLVEPSEKQVREICASLAASVQYQFHKRIEHVKVPDYRKMKWHFILDIFQHDPLYPLLLNMPNTRKIAARLWQDHRLRLKDFSEELQNMKHAFECDPSQIRVEIKFIG